MSRHFNIRVYGILIHNNRVLVSDEHRFGIQFTKFPGGGLEFGEGIKDCVVREFGEEVGINVIAKELFYITDFFQASAFDENSQVISVYYRVTTENPENISTKDIPFDFSDGKVEVHRWIPLDKIQSSAFKFPIDQHVAQLLSEM